MDVVRGPMFIQNGGEIDNYFDESGSGPTWPGPIPLGNCTQRNLNIFWLNVVLNLLIT